jgi:light-regulated signal transduction histidine kinase (bacteriophytochrome)
MVDVSETQFAESIRNRLVKQLVSVNEQLEQFAYVASHDLREPLRVIVCFTDLLAKEYGDKLDETGRQYMEINRKAAKKMEAMVADLLEYGRLGQCAERLMQTDCGAIMRQVTEALGECIRATDATIQCNPLPTMMANPLNLMRLFQNLVGNALKYHRPDHPPVIAVSAEDKKDKWLFSVADNGIGIEAPYLESIFAPFKRLHSDEQYPGTGIGLAICKRIVDSFGGAIWVDSTPGAGSTFFFTMPKRG